MARRVIWPWRRDADRLAGIVVRVATPLRPVDMEELSRDIDEMLDVYADLALGQLSLGEVRVDRGGGSPAPAESSSPISCCSSSQ